MLTEATKGAGDSQRGFHCLTFEETSRLIGLSEVLVTNRWQASTGSFAALLALRAQISPHAQPRSHHVEMTSSVSWLCRAWSWSCCMMCYFMWLVSQPCPPQSTKASTFQGFEQTKVPATLGRNGNKWLHSRFYSKYQLICCFYGSFFGPSDVRDHAKWNLALLSPANGPKHRAHSEPDTKKSSKSSQSWQCNEETFGVSDKILIVLTSCLHIECHQSCNVYFPLLWHEQ